MNTTRTRLLAAALVAALALAPASSAFARGGFRGGGFRSAPSLRSMGSSRSFSGWGSATRPSLKASPFKAPFQGSPRSSFANGGASTPRFGGASGGAGGGISGSRAGLSKQRGLFDSAQRNGTAFSSKAEASQAFKSRYAQQYSSTFASEPAARPGYIPSSVFVGGRSANIMYNAGLGGYGYMHPILGTWMLYDALSDAATLDYAMSNHGYYWGGAPVYVSHGPRFFSLAFTLLFLLVAAAAVVLAIARRKEWRR